MQNMLDIIHFAPFPCMNIPELNQSSISIQSHLQSCRASRKSPSPHPPKPNALHQYQHTLATLKPSPPIAHPTPSSTAAIASPASCPSPSSDQPKHTALFWLRIDGSGYRESASAILSAQYPVAQTNDLAPVSPAVALVAALPLLRRHDQGDRWPQSHAWHKTAVLSCLGSPQAAISSPRCCSNCRGIDSYEQRPEAHWHSVDSA
jgi:hypothetical protein